VDVFRSVRCSFAASVVGGVAGEETEPAADGLYAERYASQFAKAAEISGVGARWC
jgi:hypothetical protein